MFSKDDLRVLFEDNHLFVALKPAGVLSQADGKALPDMLSLIKDYLKEKYQKPGNVFVGLVHRLDLNVGGVMVFAKTSKAASRLSESIREHDFSKRYFAVVNGKIPVGETRSLIDFLDKNEETRTGFVTSELTGKVAKLSFTVLQNIEEGGRFFSLLRIELHTGRFHQIRLQMAHFGHPLFGDAKYGETLVKGQDGLGLFAYEIGFSHPVTKEEMQFSVLPDSGIFKQFSYFQP